MNLIFKKQTKTNKNKTILNENVCHNGRKWIVIYGFSTINIRAYAGSMINDDSSDGRLIELIKYEFIKWTHCKVILIEHSSRTKMFEWVTRIKQFNSIRKLELFNDESFDDCLVFTTQFTLCVWIKTNKNESTTTK